MSCLQALILLGQNLEVSLCNVGSQKYRSADAHEVLPFGKLTGSIFVPKCPRERQFSARILSGSFSLRILRTNFDWDLSSLHLIRCYLDAVGKSTYLYAAALTYDWRQ